MADTAYYRMDDSGSSASFGFEKSEDGLSARITNRVIFRAGTFKDSKGRKFEWTREHMKDAAANFAQLKASAFPNVPVRMDHSQTIHDVVGYFNDVRAVGDDLVADYELRDPDAIRAHELGLLRSVSSEIGRYEDNDGNTFFPAVFGLAYVDIPALEGLPFSKQRDNESDIATYTLIREDAVPTVEADDRAPAIGPDDKVNHSKGDGGDAKPDAKVEDAKPADDVKPAEKVDHAKASEESGPATFRIGDKTMTEDEIAAQLSEFSRVQREFDAFQTATRDQFRADYVSSLVTGNKVMAPQEEAFAKFAKGLDAEQFNEFRALMDGSPELSLFAEHGPGPSGGDQGDAEYSKDLNEATVANFRAMGMSDEQIAKTPAGMALAATSKEA